jgi:16S rRNA G966 N2-methylase RsmD
MKYLTQFLSFKKSFGIKFTISRILINTITRLNLLNEIELSRIIINDEIGTLFHNKVKYGIFKGMEISNKIFWGKYDQCIKFLGQYEIQVINKIIESSNNYDTFINIGAGDGYFAVGVVYSNLFDKSICFEISENGRKVIEENSFLNKVEKRVKIFNTANTESLNNILKVDNKALILIDIEGDEFDLLTEEFLLVCKNCTIIIELHDGFIKNLKNSRDDVLKKANKYFEVSYLERLNSDIYSFEELDYLNDNYRQLLFSEGRPLKMEWICFTPKLNINLL